MNASAKSDAQSIIREYELPHPPAQVWRALTEPELLEQWLMSTNMRPVVGQRFTFKSEPTPWWDGIVNCELQELEPQRCLRYSWRSGPANAPLDTVVTWTLAPTPSGGTRLALEHSGFVPSNAAALDGARQGWERMVNTLREVLARSA